MSEEANPTLWAIAIGGIGACAGSAATIVVGWFRLRTNDREADNVAHADLVSGQQRLIEQQGKQNEVLQRQLTEAITQLSRQREFYDEKMDGLYKQITDMKRRCTAPDGCWRRAED